MLCELTQKYQKSVNDSEQTKKNLGKIIQEKEQDVESIKRQCERQKQKELETLRANMTKVRRFNLTASFRIEINSLGKKRTRRV